ncbi:hypothetical protein WICMUC_000110 [Wickerhamomyces mucosus]|uniref:HTH APSES-type domain-containing protein n=1 Tax=Wickerhamomyces mucosus TaxID=1378264 RepID=A0A9P8Q0W7_9ASCO|nr:hypothetical protein WICMUC_000110 [Wickerhamomyces mucosus]
MGRGDSSHQNMVNSESGNNYSREHASNNLSKREEYHPNTSLIKNEPQIYTASYNGDQVIEIIIDGIAVTRRRNDSSFNASQILELAGVDKASKAKILEKSEKSASGFWIPYDRAVTLAQQYSVYSKLKPLFLFNISQIDNNETPNKEQITRHLGRNYSTLTDNDNQDSESPTKKAKINDLDFDIYDHDFGANPNKPYTLEPVTGAGNEQEFEQSKEIITQIFQNQEANFSILDIVNGNESLLRNVNMEVPIDDLGHTALHWASALARIQLVKELIARRAIRIRGNNQGESPLIKAVSVTNNYDQSSFYELLNLLYPCITLLDSQNRSILHHIALTAGIKKRSSASRYYLETLLEWIIKIGTNLPVNPISLGKFMKEIVNIQDKNGDTALNIAARIGNKSIVQQLLDIGGNPSVPNKANLRPIDFGVNVNGLSNIKTDPNFYNQGQNASETQISSEKILNSMKSVLSRLDSDFKMEIGSKQDRINELHQKLKQSTVKLSNTRMNYEKLKSYEIRLIELKQTLSNLNKSINEQEESFLKESNELIKIDDINSFEFDADEPFRINTIYESLLNNRPANSNPNDLPPVILLKARIKAYLQNEKSLKKLVEDLNLNSKNLELKFKKVVSLCTGVDENQIDHIIDGLVQAVESDPDEVDMDRVVGFLKRVDDI